VVCISADCTRCGARVLAGVHGREAWRRLSPRPRRRRHGHPLVRLRLRRVLHLHILPEAACSTRLPPNERGRVRLSGPTAVWRLQPHGYGETSRVMRRCLFGPCRCAAGGAGFWRGDPLVRVDAAGARTLSGFRHRGRVSMQGKGGRGKVMRGRSDLLVPIANTRDFRMRLSSAVWLGY
jgi:hypothetical protein